ncbi:MAG: 6-carboxytetrahydropterin synthase QueD [Melioribacteraceae bacterium]|nr:6-carboxytetrahydropterin synthase QueD [Melioribacteraceae bacterium]
MKIAKEFNWEMGHRLPFHQGKCKNLHGHSYKMMVEFSGEMDENGMVMDYYDVKSHISPLVEELDHAFMVKENDTEVLEFLDKINSKKVIVPFDSTAENICLYFLKKLKNSGLPKTVNSVKVKILETDNTYAEEEIDV